MGFGGEFQNSLHHIRMLRSDIRRFTKIGPQIVKLNRLRSKRTNDAFPIPPF